MRVWWCEPLGIFIRLRVRPWKRSERTACLPSAIAVIRDVLRKLAAIYLDRCVNMLRM